jgi:hypothetical protein
MKTSIKNSITDFITIELVYVQRQKILKLKGLNWESAAFFHEPTKM